MPLIEYECRGCGHHFEYLTRDGASPSCPSCMGADLQRLLSTFAVATSGGGKATASVGPGPCGSCGDPRGPGSCSMN